MNPELPRQNREELEARVTALLLGELTAEESVALCQIIAQDPALAQFHDRLHRTLDLVRESAVAPAGELSEPPAPLKLSAARREALLGRFKTVPLPEPARPLAESISWVVKLAAAIVILFILAGLFMPRLGGNGKNARVKAALLEDQYALTAGRSRTSPSPSSATMSVQSQNSTSRTDAARSPNPLFSHNSQVAELEKLRGSTVRPATAPNPNLPSVQLYLPPPEAAPAYGSADSPAPSINQTSSKDSEVVTGVIPLHNLNPTALSKELYDDKLPGIEIEANEGGNAIIASGHRADLDNFAESISQLDSKGATAGDQMAEWRLNNANEVASQIKNAAINNNGTIAPSGNPPAAIFGRRRGGGGGSAGESTASAASPYAQNGQVPPVTYTVDPVTGSTIYLQEGDNGLGYNQDLADKLSPAPAAPPPPASANRAGGAGGRGRRGGGGGMGGGGSAGLGGDSLAETGPVDPSVLAMIQARRAQLGGTDNVPPVASAPRSTQEDSQGIGFNWTAGNTLLNDGAIALQPGIAPSYNPSGTFPGNGGGGSGGGGGRRGARGGRGNAGAASDSHSDVAELGADSSDGGMPFRMDYGIPITNGGRIQVGVGGENFERPPANVVGNTAGSGTALLGDGSAGAGREKLHTIAGLEEAEIASRANETRITQENTVQTQSFDLHYADSTDVANELAALFPDPKTQRGGTASSTMNGQMNKQSTVSAVPDPRTQSVTVTASKDQMAKIKAMIDELDGDPAHRMQIYTYRPDNGNIADFYQPLKDLFGSTNANSSSLPQRALQQRMTQAAPQQSTISSASHASPSTQGEFAASDESLTSSNTNTASITGDVPLNGRLFRHSLAAAPQIPVQSHELAATTTNSVIANLYDIDLDGYAAPVLNQNGELAVAPTNSVTDSLDSAPAMSLSGYLGGRRPATNGPRFAAASDAARAVAKPLQQPDAPKAKSTVLPPIPQPEVLTSTNAFSTFSLNVSDVSFKLAAASLQNGAFPDRATVRSEEFINAFDYRDSEPAPGAPIGFAWERSAYPFAHNRDLLRLSVKTAAEGRQAGRPLNLVLLLDKSGSMERADRVAIIREALRTLAAQLQPQDKFTVIVFARTARLWADGVPGNQAGAVTDGLSGITPEGGTNLEEAMKLAYEAALRHYLPNGENRVVVLTDGAANLGEVEPDALKKKVEANRAQGVALDCFGIGWEDYNDNLLEVLSRAGGGRYGFVNTPEEAASGFAGQLAGALRVAASDVKVQVEFNPARVISYRQIGYAKDQLAKEQFRDNSVKAAQIGVAESGNALYTVEINSAGDGPLCTVHVRYRDPGTSDYHEHAWDVPYTGAAPALDQSSPAMRLAATASAFSEWLAASPYAGDVNLDQLLGYMRGVPQFYGADARPAHLEEMLREAKILSGK